ncbi:MAG: hypothetical protein F9K46_11480 [Anaerolineae bacterium]|nr:MAG: hypothetical protein F9K46_11480 [Anaerolineae bacterium]
MKPPSQKNIRHTHTHSKKRRGGTRLPIFILAAIGICLLLALPFLLGLDLSGQPDAEPSAPPRSNPVTSPISNNPLPSLVAGTLDSTAFHQATLAAIHTQQANDAVLVATQLRQQALDATATAQTQ